MNYPSHHLSPFLSPKLPSIFRDTVFQLTQEVQCAPELAGSTALGVSASVIQGIADLHLQDGRVFPLTASIIGLAESGGGKSTLLTRLTHPLRGALDDFQRNTKNIVSEAEYGRQKLRAGYAERQHGIDFFEDATVEGLLSNMSGDSRVVACLTDEGSSFFNGRLGRDLSAVIRALDGAAFTHLRAKDTIRAIGDPRLSIVALVQPAAFWKFIKRDGLIAKSSGFLARSLICQPPSNIGFRDWNLAASRSEQKPVILVQRLVELANRQYLASHDGKPSRLALKMSSQAFPVWIEIAQKVEFMLQPGGVLNAITEFGAKIASHVAKMAALFALIEYDHGIVDLRHIDASRQIMNYFISEHLRLTGPEIQLPPQLRMAQALADYLAKNFERVGVEYWTRRDLMRKGPAALRNALHMDEAISVLLETGVVLRCFDAKGKEVLRYSGAPPVWRHQMLPMPPLI